ncbi:hypothetical protein [Streptomyces endophytica]|uniref:Lipoprotein n=1 Tax=Streptomyces endophytica TaxID=2991496 RepID=A0ABY6PAE9_9ACTN|nr:hypothetical protein [Streptomyces endophytica]UZJ30804.1 hypothetical protein OJ254_11185 [Streptomyces endophytica]
MRSTRMTAVVAGVVMMAGLTACNGSKSDDAGGSGGGSGSGQSPLQVALASLKTAAQQTDGKKSAEVDGTLKNATSTQSMKGAMDWSQGMRMNLDIKQSAGMMAGRPTKAVYTSDAMYMNMGTPVGGKSWIKYDYDALAKKMGPAGALIKDQMNNNNPTRAMELLIASGKVKAAGKEDVRGVQATHYTGTLSISELTRMQSKNVSETDMKALEQQLKTSGAGQESIDLWIGPDNLLVKKREQLVGGKVPYDSTVFYSHYGTKVTDQTPSAGDTVDFDKVGKP